MSNTRGKESYCSSSSFCVSAFPALLTFWGRGKAGRPHRINMHYKKGAEMEGQDGTYLIAGTRGWEWRDVTFHTSHFFLMFLGSSSLEDLRTVNKGLTCPSLHHYSPMASSNRTRTMSHRTTSYEQLGYAKSVSRCTWSLNTVTCAAQGQWLKAITLVCFASWYVWYFCMQVRLHGHCGLGI